MQTLLHRWLPPAALALALAATGLASANAQTTAAPDAKAPPAGFVAPAEPKPDESNAQRAKSQPGNNAPMWRAVRESGDKPGTSSLPGLSKPHGYCLAWQVL